VHAIQGPCTNLRPFAKLRAGFPLRSTGRGRNQACAELVVLSLSKHCPEPRVHPEAEGKGQGDSIATGIVSFELKVSFEFNESIFFSRPMVVSSFPRNSVVEPSFVRLTTEQCTTGCYGIRGLLRTVLTICKNISVLSAGNQRISAVRKNELINSNAAFFYFTRRRREVK
jgi:hypothetical protein